MVKTTNGKFHDMLGNLYYQVKASDGKIFSVTKPKGTDPVTVIREQTYCNTNAMVMDDGGFFWNEAPVFDSFIHAVRWLKANVENLL